MVWIDLIYNLALLVALSVVSGFVETRWRRHTRLGALLQGMVFGGAAVIGMLRPFVFAPGLIFDGRSVMISLGGLFFGPWAAAVACLMAILLRLAQGGSGVGMGVLVILASAAIGVGFHLRRKRRPPEMPAATLLVFGVVVHLAMLAMTVALPPDMILPVLKRIGWPVMLTYPLATVLIGRILSDQAARAGFLESLQESERRFRVLFEQAAVGVARIETGTGRFLQVNQRYADIVGYSVAGMQERNFQSITHPDDLPAEIGNMELLKAGTIREFAMEKRYRRQDGSLVWVALTVSPLWAPGEAPGSHIAVVQDITGRKQSEAALRQEQGFFKDLVNTLPAGVYRLRVRPAAEWSEANWRSQMELLYSVEMASDRFCEITGISRQEFEANPQIVPDRIHPEDSPGFVRSNAAAVVSLTLFSWEGRMIVSAKRTIWVHLESTPRLLENGEATWTGIVYDITEQKQAEAQILDQLHELRRWQAVMLNQSDRSQDPKREVNELARRLGEPIRYPSQAPVGNEKEPTRPDPR